MEQDFDGRSAKNAWLTIMSDLSILTICVFACFWATHISMIDNIILLCNLIN
jgi:hypothetical protein